MNSFPFTSILTTVGETVQADRPMSAEDWRHLFNVFYKNGVFANPSTNFQVTTSASTGLYVTVNPGICFIEGAIGIEESSREMQLQAANASYDRIDTIVARLDLSTEVRSIDLYVLTGTAATIPDTPTLTRAGGIYELGLANIYIPATSTSISIERITDTRLDTARCGIVTCLPEVIDTTTIFESYEGYLEEIDTILANALDQTLAGQLQNEITTLQNSKATVNYYTGSIGTTWVDQTGYYTQEINVAGILATDNPVIDYLPNAGSVDASITYDWGNIYKIVAETDKLLIYTSIQSTVIIPIKIMVVR